MREIQLRDAKATLSAVIDGARDGEVAIISRHGKPAGVILGFDEWQRLSRVPSFARLLMAAPLEPADLPLSRARPTTSFKNRRRKAGWDVDYLETVLRHTA